MWSILHTKNSIAIMIPLSIVLMCSCNYPNPNNLPHFDKDGNYLEKVSYMKSQAPSKIHFYVEVSGSMNGFFRSNKPTTFKADVWSVFSDFSELSDGVNIFVKQNADPVNIPLEDFRSKMNAGAFVSSASTDVPDMIKRVLASASKDSEVSVLVSDMKYDPVGNAAQSVLLQQYSVDIRNMMGKSGKSVCLIVAKSDFLDKTGNIVCDNSPYYYLVIGTPENVVWMRNFICTLLKHNNHYVDAIEWGIDYKTPVITVSDEGYLMKEGSQVLRKFEDDCAIVLDIDITNFPWLFENKDTLLKYLSVKCKDGTKITPLKDKSIKYIITEDDGKQLKRKAVAKLKLQLSEMYDKADVLEIKLSTPEILLPNNEFSLFIGTDDANDVAHTFSIEHFLTGCYSSIERFRDAKPFHLLISKN